MPKFQAKDGTELFFYDWGTGAPVILIHGWPLTSASWEYQARTLAENGYRVLAYDRRGFGRSDWPWTGYDYDTLASDLHQLIETLDLHDVTLAGFSMGGGEVARYLGTYDQSRIKGAVFIAAVTPYLLKTDSNPNGAPKSIFDDIVANLTKDRPAFLHEFAGKFYNRTLLSHTVSEETLEFFSEMALTASPDATIKLVRAWSETDFRDNLRKISVPTLFIHGTGDSTVPIDISAREAVKLVPGAEILEYEGEPHGLTNTAPDRLNSDLLAFLRRSTARPS